MASTINAKNTSTGVVITPDSSGQLELQTADTTRMTIDVNGNVGIGTSTTTDTRLRVKQSADTGAASFSFKVEANANDTGLFIGYRGVGAATAADTCAISATYGTTGAFKPITFLTSDAERMRIDSSGNVIITDTTNSSLSAVGCYNETTGSGANMVIASNGFMVRSTSSLKYKQNVKDATHGLADVLKLRPVTYESKKESEAGITYGGLIAEEVHDAGLTEFVQYADDGTPDALSYGHMVSLAFKAIQELKAEVDALKAELAALKGAA